MLELIAREVGLAEAYRWVPLGDLRNDSDSDEPRETQAELKARQAEHSREHYRKSVLHRLEQEKDDPDLRTRRKDMFCWTRTSGTDMRAIIIETLREISVSVCAAVRRPDHARCVAMRVQVNPVPLNGSCELVLSLCKAGTH